MSHEMTWSNVSHLREIKNDATTAELVARWWWGVSCVWGMAFDMRDGISEKNSTFRDKWFTLEYKTLWKTRGDITN